MRLFTLLLLLSLSLQALSACGQGHLSADDVTNLPSRPPDHRLAYGRAPQQFGELRLPQRKGKVPVVVVIHGGCWLSDVADRRNTAALADALRAAGFATWNVEYRRLGDADGGWPGTFQDVSMAVDFVRTLARTYSLDTARVLVVGHSAGGHLALWAAARSKLPRTSPLRGSAPPLRVRGAISLGGPDDLRTFATYGAAICGAETVTQLLGGPAASVPSHWRDGSPPALLPLRVPTRLLVGTDDPVVPAPAARTYERTFRAAGDDARYVPLPDAGHFEEIAPTAACYATVLATVRALLGENSTQKSAKTK